MDNEQGVRALQRQGRAGPPELRDHVRALARGVFAILETALALPAFAGTSALLRGIREGKPPARALADANRAVSGSRDRASPFRGEPFVPYGA